MARNDVVLLDSLVNKSREQLGKERRIDELFELFCMDQILKDYDLSFDDLETGWTDGSDDAGIDGMFTFLDSKIVLDEGGIETGRRNPLLEVYVIAAKHADSFQQAPLDKLLSTLPALFDLRNPVDRLPFPVNSELTNTLSIFHTAYIGLANRHPALKMTIIYVCRGDSSSLPANIGQRGEHLEDEIGKLFSDAQVTMQFLGATELLRLSRKTKVYSLRLRYIESYVSRDRTNYVVLTLLPDYYSFVTDEDGHLRRYLFESNVRDYLGGQVNRDIEETLAQASSPNQLDFWWLNNGITLLASSATVAGKEISLDNVQIVNGLQTTETIHNHFVGKGSTNDERALLIKIIVADSPEVRDKIIKATNYQNAVETASLRATDKIQRDIEHYMADHGWFYDRRKGFHKNQGRPADKIVAISYLGAAVRAIALSDPLPAIERKTRWIRDDEDYRRIFNEQYGLSMYRACLEIMKATEATLRDGFPGLTLSRHRRRELAPLVSLMYVMTKLRKRHFGVQEIAQLEGVVPSREEIADLFEVIESESAAAGKTKPPVHSKTFVESVLNTLSSNLKN